MEPHPEHDNSIWTASEPLSLIARWSAYCLVSPWAVLGGILTRLAAEDAWTHRIPGLSGGRRGSGTSALFAVMMGESSRGKSQAREVASDIAVVRGGRLPPENRDRNLSTPEGMVAFFLDRAETEGDGGDEEDGKGKPKKKKPWVQKRYQALGWIDELGGALKVGGRSANWLLEALSSAYTGHWSERAVLTDPTPAAAPHTHFSLLAGAQNAGLAKVLGGEAAAQGWTNRLILLDAAFPASPPLKDLPDEEPPMLRLNVPDCGECPVCSGDPGADPFIYPEARSIREEIRRERWESLTSREPLNNLAGAGHELLAKRRLAKHFAVLHRGGGEETGVREEDWEMAGLVLNHSNALRAYLDENLVEFTEAEQRTYIVEAALKFSATRNQPARSAFALQTVSLRLYKKTADAGFRLSDVGRSIGKKEREILALNGQAAGSPSKQVVIYLYDTGCLDWEGRAEGHSPRGYGAHFAWRRPPPS